MEKSAGTKFYTQTNFPIKWPANTFNSSDITCGELNNNSSGQMGQNIDNTGAAANGKDEIFKNGLIPLEVASNSSEGSGNNSTDNLSCLSENVEAEEDIFQQNSFSEEEEVSINSDDCIYAYRGMDYEAAEQRQNPVDDETDFLEMDFDPDPASEDNANDCKISVFNTTYDHEANIEDTSNFCRTYIDTQNILNIEEKNCLLQKNLTSDCKPILYEEKGSKLTDKHKITGTKPKQMFDKKLHRVPKASETLEAFVDQNSELPVNTYDNEESCLDCLEQEFLSSTVGKVIESFNCRKCIYKKYDSTANELSVKSNFFPENAKEVIFSLHNKNYIDMQNSANCNDEKLLEIRKKECATFCSVNVNEEIITQALVKLRVSYCRELFTSYFEESHLFKDVPEFILHMAKKNCDYKNIIRLIRSACSEELDIKFIPDQNSSKACETVQIDVCDILQIWTPKSDLQKLKHFGKRFLQMNVLGKVINVIRQAQRRDAQPLGGCILIPQYYKTGYICITKK